MSDTTDDAIDIGSVLEGRYEVVDLLGEGGFGRVFKARQMSTGQFVAVKLMHPAKVAAGRGADAIAAETARFEREMALIARLKHPNIVRLIDSGQLPGGHLFTVLEFIEGEELSELLAREGRLEVREAQRLMTQVLEALATAHSQGIVHRDLKPQNIMVTRSGSRRNAMVLDFGIATLVDEARSATFVTLTQTGQVHGTPAYMAPEQLEGQVSVQSDLYAWGLVFCEAVSGKRVIDADSVASAIYQQLSRDKLTVPDTIDNPAMREVIARAIAKPLESRYASADQLLADLEHCVLAGASTSLRMNTGDVAPPPDDPSTLALDQTVDPDHDDASTLGTMATAVVTEIDRNAARALAEDDPRRTLDERVQTPTDSQSTDATSPPSSRQRLRLAVALVALVLAGVGAVTAWILSTREDSTPPARAEDSPCPAGQSVTGDTDGQCCWAGQAWNGARCVGVPESCPEGYLVNAAAQACSLPPCNEGMVRDGEHCCWPEQAWSEQQDRCIGAPACPDEFLVDGEQCLALEPAAWVLATGCQANNLGDCVQLAARLQDGRGAERSPERALSLLKQACDGNNAEGCHELAMSRLVDRSSDEESDEADRTTQAIELLEKACTAGRQPACFDLSTLLLRRGEARTVGRAVELMESACTANDLRACDTLGQMLQHGRAVRIDLPRAAQLYERACAGGYMFACTHLGWMLRDGQGVAADPTRAARLFGTACDKGEALACAHMATLVEATDATKAAELRKKACQDGWFGACE